MDKWAVTIKKILKNMYLYKIQNMMGYSEATPQRPGPVHYSHIQDVPKFGFGRLCFGSG